MNKFEEIKLPENIDEITEKAILQGEKEMKDRKKQRKVIKAASIVLGVSIIGMLGVTKPAIAAKVPFIGNLFKHLNEESNEKSIYTNGDMYEDAVNVETNVKDNGIEINVKEVSCDGSNVYISYVITSDKKMKGENIEGFTLIAFDTTTDIDDERLQVFDPEGKFEDEYTYLGVQKVSLNNLIKKGIEIPETFNLKLNISEVDYALSSEANSDFERVSGKWNFNIPVKNNDEGSRVIKPNITSNGINLDEIILSKGDTKISYISDEKLPDGAIIDVIDNNKKYIQWDEGHEEKTDNGVKHTWILEHISNDAKSINIMILDKNNNGKILAEFDVKLK